MFNSKRLTSATSAGLSALPIRICDDSFQRTMSIFSPPSSSTMFLMRLPRRDAGADRIDFGIDRRDGDLVSMAGLARQSFDLDRSFIQLRALRGSKSDGSIPDGPAQDDFNALGVSRTSMIQGSEPLADLMGFHREFARRARHNAFDAAEIDIIVRFKSRDRPR